MYCEGRLHLLSTGLSKMVQTEKECNGSDQFLTWVRSHGPRSITFVQFWNVLSLQVGRIRMIGHVHLQPYVILKYLWSLVVYTKELIQGDTATVKLLPSVYLSIFMFLRSASWDGLVQRRLCSSMYAVVSVWMWSTVPRFGRAESVAAFST